MLANEYANALFALATEKQIVEEIASEFKIFVDAINQNEDFLKVVLAPNINKNAKKMLISSITNNFNELFTNFLYVLNDNSRFSNIFDIYKIFELIILEMNKIRSIDVYSAKELSLENKNEIIKKIKVLYKCNEVIITSFVDSRLIGGYKIISNGKSLDLSLKDKLEQIKSTL